MKVESGLKYWETHYLYSNLIEQNPQSIWQLSLASQREADDHNLVFDVWLHLAVHSAVSAKCIKGLSKSVIPTES